MKSLLARGYVALQRILPQHVLSRIVHAITRIESRLSHFFIGLFVRGYQVDLNEAARPKIESYRSFNDFFTRALADGARVIDAVPDVLVSPVDGCVSQIGHANGDQLLQAKGRHYSLTALLGDATVAGDFGDAAYATLYLAPRDYHRIHMPVSGRLTLMRLVPGRLYSVDETTVASLDRVFARNERVVCRFETDMGPVAVVMIGALFVGSIETVWHGEVTPGSGRVARNWRYQADTGPTLARGAELGRFNMGSTVIVLAPRHLRWEPALGPGQQIRMGERLGRYVEPSESK